jgi:hypothetical protein
MNYNLQERVKRIELRGCLGCLRFDHAVPQRLPIDYGCG